MLHKATDNCFSKVYKSYKHKSAVILAIGVHSASLSYRHPLNHNFKISCLIKVSLAVYH